VGEVGAVLFLLVMLGARPVQDYYLQPAYAAPQERKLMNAFKVLTRDTPVPPHLVASGMGGAEEENFLIFDVGPTGVQIQVQRLDGQPLKRGTIEAYDLAYYSNPH
jgi:hypothetical protein